MGNDLDKLMSRGVNEVLPEINTALEIVDPNSDEAKELRHWKRLLTKWQTVEKGGFEHKKPEIFRKTFELSASSIL